MEELEDQSWEGAYFQENIVYVQCTFIAGLLLLLLIFQYRRSYRLCGKTGTLSVQNVARLVVGGIIWPPNW